MKLTDLFIRRPVLAICVNLVILIAGLGPEALHRRIGLDGLGRVHPDVAHILIPPIDASDDRVAVDDPDNPSHDRAARWGPGVAGGAPIGATALDE